MRHRKNKNASEKEKEKESARFARFNVQLHSVVCDDLKPRRRDGENAVPDERSEVFRPILRLVRAIVRNAVEET